MIKTRPVVVISPRRRSSPRICTIVPLSTTAPNPVEPFHHRMNPQSLPVSFRKQDSWAKCDMLYTMALDRLDRVKLRIGGRRAYRAPQVLVEDLDAIRRGIAKGPWLDVGHRQEASCVGVPDESGLEDYPLLWVAVPGQRSKPGRGPDQGSAAAEPFVFQGLLPLPLSRASDTHPASRALSAGACFVAGEAVDVDLIDYH